MSARGKAWKIAAVVTALVCTGAAATAFVGVKIHRYYFEGRDAKGVYHFGAEPEIVYQSADSGITVSSGYGVSIGSNDPNFTIDVEQTRKDLEEIALLRQQGAGELVGVIDTEVNGHFHRTFRYQYALSDGRTHTMGEGDPDAQVQRTPEEIERDHEEVARLREQGERDVVTVIDTGVEGQISRTLSCRYVLADGREMTIGEGDPEWPEPTRRLSSEQIHELWRLKRLDQGEFLEQVDQPMYGKVFTFESYLYTLADGTVATLAVGEPKSLKTRLTEADWQEFRDLREAGAGEDLGTEEKVVKGRVFSFKRQRFILSDGTEFIWSVGVPKDD